MKANRLIVCAIAAFTVMTFTACGDDEPQTPDVTQIGGSEDDADEPESPDETPSDDDDIYAGMDFVGAWQGTDGSDEFYIELDADGSYTDYVIQNGSKNFQETGTYTVNGNTLTVPHNANLYICWGAGNETTFTISFSGKNTMNITNPLMEKWKQLLILYRQ